MDCPVHSLNKRNKVSNWGRHFQIIFSWTFRLELWKYSQWFLRPLPSNYHLHHLRTDAFNATASLNFICLVGCIGINRFRLIELVKRCFLRASARKLFPNLVEMIQNDKLPLWSSRDFWRGWAMGKSLETTVPRFPGSPVFDLRQKPANSGVLFALGYPRCTFLLNTYLCSVNARCTILSLATLW